MRQTPDGRWHFDVRIKRADGTKFRRSGSAETEKEARHRRDAVRHVSGAGASNVSVSALIPNQADYGLTFRLPTSGDINEPDREASIGAVTRTGSL